MMKKAYKVSTVILLGITIMNIAMGTIGVVFNSQYFWVNYTAAVIALGTWIVLYWIPRKWLWTRE